MQRNTLQSPTGVDGRTIEARRFKEVLQGVMGCLGHNPTLGQTALARRVAGLQIICERFEADIASGLVITNGEYTRACGLVSRLLDRLQIVDVGIAPGAAEFASTSRDKGSANDLDDYLESRGRLPVFRPPKKTRAKLKEFVSGSD